MRIIPPGLFALLALCAPIAAQVPAPQSSPKEDLKAASAVRRQSFGKKGQERTEILERAAKMYDDVCTKYADRKEVVQEASFRGAEIFRSLGRSEGAAQRYKTCVDLAATKAYTARAMLELGHLERRRSNYKVATQWYERTATEFKDLLPYRDTALTWIGKLLQQKGDLAGARQRWEQVAVGGERATARIRCFDMIAVTYVTESKRKEAEATLARCRAAFEEQAKGESSEARRIAKALAKMRVIKLLASSK